jgi:hypothetical protein
VAVGGEGAVAGGAGWGVLVFACGAAFGAVGGVGVAAVLAATGGHVVGGDGAVAVAASGRVGFGLSEGVGVGQSWGSVPAAGGRSGCGEQQVVLAQVPGMSPQLVVDVVGQGDAPPFVVLGILLDEEAAAVGVDSPRRQDRNSLGSGRWCVAARRWAEAPGPSATGGVGRRAGRCAVTCPRVAYLPSVCGYCVLCPGLGPSFKFSAGCGISGSNALRTMFQSSPHRHAHPLCAWRRTIPPDSSVNCLRTACSNPSGLSSSEANTTVPGDS